MFTLRQIRRHNRAILSIFFNTKVCCLFSLESPRRGDTIEYTQYTIFNIKICSYGFLFQGTQERDRNSRGKQTITVLATEVLLNIQLGYIIKEQDIACLQEQRFFVTTSLPNKLFLQQTVTKNLCQKKFSKGILETVSTATYISR